MTALGNDVGFEYTFAKQVQLLGRKDDLLILISASGNSPNLIEAAHEAKKIGMPVVAMTGFDGGRLKQLGDLSIHVSTEVGDYGPVEDAHLAVNHMVTESLRNHFVNVNS